MSILKTKIELLLTEDSGKLAVSSLTHITPAIIANVQGSNTIEGITTDVLNESMTYLLSDFDAEIGKNRTFQRYIELSPQTRFDSTKEYTIASVGTLVGEELVLSQPMPYSSLKVRRLFVDASIAVDNAVIRVVDINTGTTTNTTADLAAGLNRVDLDITIDTDFFAGHIKAGVVSNGVAGFRPIVPNQLTGRVRRTSTDINAWCQWELIIDMDKISDFFATELLNAYYLRCGVNVLDRHNKSQNANRSTLVGREELANNRAELHQRYEQILANSCKKIYEAVSKQPAVRHASEFDRGISVGSIV